MAHFPTPGGDMDLLAQRTLNIAREALDVDDPAERIDCVRRMSGGDGELQDRVFKLLDQAKPEVEATAPEAKLSETEFTAGASFGPYRLLRPLGQGGMGTVWLAERADGMFQREVALKLLRGGWLRPDEHFRRERDILARLGHPNIAQLYDGGASGDQPWFALEYVGGEQIVVWCDQHRQDVRARIRLFLPICAAVQFAHQHLVVHRDIKPANVLVAQDGTPKLLDFGIAKLLDQADARHTQTFAMTPAYASPEQGRGEPVRTAGDVYQLGLLLYEMLVGRSAHDLRLKRPDRIAPRIDQAIAALAPDDMRDVARSRGMAPERVRAIVRGDLARIVAKAMADAPVERYESAQALLHDLENWLHGMPVRAHRGSYAYRARKFAQRNWALSAAVLGLIIVSAYYLVDLREKSKRIAAERDQALAVAGFLQDLFRGANPHETGAPDLSARELLDRGVARLEKETKVEPRTRAQLESTMAKSYQGLGIYDAARKLYDSALATFRSPTQGDLGLAARTLKDSAASALEASDTTDAETDLAVANELIRRLGTRPSIQLAYAHATAAMSLGNLYRTAEAAPHYEQIAEMRSELFSQDPRFFAETMFLRASNEAVSQHAERAAGYARESVAVNLEAFGEKGPDYAVALGLLADALTDLGDYDEAESNYLAAILRLRETLGKRHRQVGVKLNDLGLLYLRLGRFKEADATLEESLAIMMDVYGPSHLYLASPLIYLGWSAFETNDLGRARGQIARATRIVESDNSESYLARVRHVRARIECRSGEFEAARIDFAEARAVYEKEADPFRGPALLAHLAECLASTGHADDARALLPVAIVGLQKGIGAQAWDTRQAIALQQRIGQLPDVGH